VKINDIELGFNSSQSSLNAERTTTNVLDQYGYRVTRKTGSRHQTLGKAIRSESARSIKRELAYLKQNVLKDYKARRIQADLNWLKKQEESWGGNFL